MMRQNSCSVWWQLGGMLIGPFTLIKMLKFCLDYPIGQLSSFLLPSNPSSNTNMNLVLFLQSYDVELALVTCNTQKVMSKAQEMMTLHAKKWCIHSIQVHVCATKGPHYLKVIFFIVTIFVVLINFLKLETNTTTQQQSWSWIILLKKASNLCVTAKHWLFKF